MTKHKSLISRSIIIGCVGYCLGYGMGTVQSGATDRALYGAALAVLVCALFGVLSALWLRRSVKRGAEDTNSAASSDEATQIAELRRSVASILDHTPGLTSSKDVETGTYAACNQAFAEYVLKSSPEEVVGLRDADIFDEATAAHFAEDDKRALEMDRPYVFYEDVTDAAGNLRRFHTVKQKFIGSSGRLCILGMSIDLTELMHVQEETAAAQEAYKRAQNASTMYSHIAHALSANYSSLYYVDLETGEYIEYGDVEGGEAPAETQGENFFDTVRDGIAGHLHADDRAGFLEAFTRENILRVLSEHGTFMLTCRYLTDGETSYVSLRVIQMQDDDRHVIIGVNTDEEIGVRNELTGLYMEASLSVYGKELLQEVPEGWCLIAIDLEHFKLFNEWYGRDQGDRLLAQVGERLSAVEDETGALVCYMGQDDFCLIAPYEEDDIHKLYSDIHEIVKGYGTSVGFMPAFGVCMIAGENTIEELYDRAALAAHHAKENYHTRIRIFEDSMYQKTERDYQILSDFQKALKEHELFIMLQPQCDVETGKVVGAESLVRWKKANEQKLVSPGIFVPVLEQYGFVPELDKFVWEEVCAWQKNWIGGGHTPLPISVNVSQIDIFSINVPEYFAALIKKYDLPTDVIKIEITESAYVGDDAVADTVTRLREMGFLVLMDDFGSGYSSLNMLRNINVDIIKLDAQFLRMNNNDRKGIHILESIVNMAKTMGVPIIVEGVETQEETDFISSLGCRYVQGYFFYRPMPVPDFEALIGEAGNIDTRGFLFRHKEEFHTREFLDENVFSDVMLNNILGPVAFFLLHDNQEIDCVRYNQQFYNEVGPEHFDRVLRSAQRLVVEEDLPALYGMLEQAVDDPLNGGMDVLRFRRANGSVSQFRLHMFYLDEEENGKRFYGSAHDITHLDRMGEQMRMLSRLTDDEVIFVHKRGDTMQFQVAVHGLEDFLGISREEFELEMNSGAFFERISGYDRDWLEQMVCEAGMKMRGYSPDFAVMGAGGRTEHLQARFDAVRGEGGGSEYVLVLRRVKK